MGLAMNSTLPQYFLRAVTRGGVFLGLLREFGIAAEYFAESDFDENECPLHLVDIDQIWVGSGWYSSNIYEVWRCAMPVLEELLGLVRREYPWWYLSGGLRTLLISFGR
jgi:hypothetical protein